MLNHHETYTVKTISPNVQVGDIVYVKTLDSGSHAVGEVLETYAHGIHVMLYMAKPIDETTYEVVRKLYPEFVNINMSK